MAKRMDTSSQRFGCLKDIALPYKCDESCHLEDYGGIIILDDSLGIEWCLYI